MLLLSFNGLAFFADVFFFVKWANGTLIFTGKKCQGGRAPEGAVAHPIIPVTLRDGTGPRVS